MFMYTAGYFIAVSSPLQSRGSRKPITSLK